MRRRATIPAVVSTVSAGCQPVLPAGPFPRDMALTSSGTLLASDCGTENVQAIDTATLGGG